MRMDLDKYKTYLQYELNRSVHTVTSYIADITEFIQYHTGGDAGNFDPASVKPLDIREWLAAMAAAGIKARSLRRKTSSLRSLYLYLMRTGEITVNPTSDIILAKAPAPLPAFIPEKEMEKLILQENEACRYMPDVVPEGEHSDGTEREGLLKEFRLQRDALIMELLYATGMRAAEITSLRDSDIDLRRLELKVTGKRNKQRVLPLPPGLAKKIEEYKSLRDKAFGADSPFLLLSFRGKPLNQTSLSNIVKVELAGVPSNKKSPHVLRHSFATAMLNNGADINTVKEFLGHSNLDTTQIYTHLSFADLKRNYNHAHPRAIKKDD